MSLARPGSVARSFLTTLFAIASLLLGVVPFAHAATLVSGTVSGAWTSSGSPYVVTGSLYVAPGSTLSIDSGVVVKLYFGTGLTVDGTLDVHGTASDKAVFTSVKDDLVDGQDSSNDGPTIGAPGDWNSIVFNPGSTGSISNAAIRYGGWTCFTCAFANVANKGGNVTITDSAIANAGWYGIRQTDPGASTVIHGSSITGNAGYGVYNDTTTVVDATNDWWGAASGPFHPTQNPSGTGNRVSDYVNFAPYLSYDPMAVVPTPSLSTLGQFKEDGTTAIAEGGTTTDAGAIL